MAQTAERHALELIIYLVANFFKHTGTSISVGFVKDVCSILRKRPISLISHYLMEKMAQDSEL